MCKFKLGNGALYVQQLWNVAYSSCAKQMKPPSCVRRTPAGDSAFTMRVLTFLFEAICISLCNLFFWRFSPRYLSVSMRYSGLGLLGFCRLRIRFSASSSEKSTKLLLSEALRRFSRIPMRFSVSSAVVSQIIWRNKGDLVSAVTWDGVLADPVVLEKAALFGLWVSHLWCSQMWLMNSWLWLVLGGDATIMLRTPSVSVGLSALMIDSWKLYRAFGLFRVPLIWSVFSCLTTLLKTFHRNAVSSSNPRRIATG